MSGRLVVRALPGESWRDAVKRIAGKYGLAGECLAIFDEAVAGEADEAQAAFDALYEWDCVDFETEAP